MKKIFRTLLALVLSLTGVLGIAGGCTDGKQQPSVQDDLRLKFAEQSVTMENNRIRIVLNKSNGAIGEIYNKTRKLYLVKDNEDAEAVSLRVRGSSLMVNQLPSETGFACDVISDTAAVKSVQFQWSFPVGARVTGTVTLCAGTDEIAFRASVTGAAGNVYAVQYPVIDNIGAITGEGERDYLVSSFATGYLFENPYKNFVRYGQDLSGQSAVTPSGFGSTMQFMGYFTEGKGGFQIQTKDGGNTVKDFVFRNDGGTLQAEIGHYIGDISKNSTSFAYDTVLSNLYEGNWYESAERYQAWAVEQTWVKRNGRNSARSDLNRELYENAVLANFIAPSKSDQSAYALPLYEKIRSNITAPGSKILTVPFYYSIPQEVGPDDDIAAYFNTHKDEAFYRALAENGEPVAQFEYTDLQQERKMSALPGYITQNRVKDETGGYRDIMFAENWQYICAGSEQWTKLVTDRQGKQFTQLNMQGIYNDLGICAVHPVNCYDVKHAHGSEVNVLDDYLALLERSHGISRRYTVDENRNNGFTGQEMIVENAIPFVDFYQARANAGEMSGMEHDRIMKLVQNGAAVKIPLFEYVYHEYSGVRTDGFTLPVASVGTPYYYSMAFTALNGGIPQFNYECYDHSDFGSLVNDLDTGMIRFVDTLGQARRTYGKNYLVYGKMARSPDLGISRRRFAYETPIVINWGQVGGLKKGNMLLDPVVISAFRSGEDVAIFLCNVTDGTEQLSFDLNAAALYGLTNGTVSMQVDGQNAGTLGTLDENGRIHLDLTADSRKVIMLTVSGGSRV